MKFIYLNYGITFLENERSSKLCTQHLKAKGLFSYSSQSILTKGGQKERDCLSRRCKLLLRGQDLYVDKEFLSPNEVLAPSDSLYNKITLSSLCHLKYIIIK